jgi:MerR family transcriptional regulator, thiopeptide resistance regulator
MSLLKVGELAKRSGLTVRTLHHYDEIGLLVPSVRSDSGYRLYDRADVARLHAIQALRKLGLPLSEVGEMLACDGATLPAIVERQIHALDREIEQASELRARLTLVQAAMATGNAPSIGDWLDTLSLMSTYGKYFAAEELKSILQNLKRMESEWQPLTAQIREQMALGVPPTDLSIQPLARRWMDLSIRWMEGDMDRLIRWGRMYREEVQARGRHGIDLDVIDYIGKAVEMRLEALHRHLSPEDVARLDKTLDPQCRQYSAELQALMDEGLRPESPRAREMGQRWFELMNRMVRGDAGLQARLVKAFDTEPLLREGAVLSGRQREFIRQAMGGMPQARETEKGLDPHAA